MKAPDKIYIDDLAVVNDCVTKISLKQLPNFSEYIRKDALTEWAKAELGELIDGLREEINRELSLSSNLDEAAEAYAFTNWEDNDYHEGASEGVPFDPIGYTKKVFKAGAKWMARQGETHEQYVIREIAGHDIGPAIVSYPDTFEIGDKVIVQIRKEY